MVPVLHTTCKITACLSCLVVLAPGTARSQDGPGPDLSARKILEPMIAIRKALREGDQATSAPDHPGMDSSA